METRAYGVSVFAISPGTVKTAMTREAFTSHWDDEDIGSLPELAAELVVRIGSGALDAYSGRYTHATYDDWRTWSKHRSDASVPLTARSG